MSVDEGLIENARVPAVRHLRRAARVVQILARWHGPLLQLHVVAREGRVRELAEEAHPDVGREQSPAHCVDAAMRLAVQQHVPDVDAAAQLRLQRLAAGIAAGIALAADL